MNILMPQLGETVSEGKVTTWFKSVGDSVRAGDNLFEIETDKATMEIQAVEGGVLSEILVPAGAVAPVGAVVAIIGDGAAHAPPPVAGAHTANSTPSGPVLAPAAAAAPATALGPPIKLDPFNEVRTPAKNYGKARTAGGATATPLARRLAAETGVDFARIKGSGPGGRIVANDIRPAPTSPAAAVTGDRPSVANIKSLYADTPYEEVPLDGMRRTIAARLLLAKQTIPHFYIADDVDIGAMAALREQLNDAAPRDKNGSSVYKFSLNDFIIKAWAMALRAVPAANAVWAEDRILRFTRCDVAVAVAVDGGLITPLIRNADAKPLRAISSEMRDLATRARARKLMPNEYQGGATAISNLGMYGVREFSAIINPPHGTILAVGAARRQAVEKEDGGVAFASVMTVTLSCDHRVVDGALGAELLAAFKDAIGNPLRIVV
jgi:pyruvate dehydrogenase E2 component (dihydrolipoamide acetyltransferase)